MVFFNRLVGDIFGNQKKARNMPSNRLVPDHILREARNRPAGASKADLVDRLVNLRKLQSQRQEEGARKFRGIPMSELNKILTRNKRSR